MTTTPITIRVIPTEYALSISTFWWRSKTVWKRLIHFESDIGKTIAEFTWILMAIEGGQYQSTKSNQYNASNLEIKSIGYNRKRRDSDCCKTHKKDGIENEKPNFRYSLTHRVGWSRVCNGFFAPIGIAIKYSRFKPSAFALTGLINYITACLHLSTYSNTPSSNRVRNSVIR